jgi:hypothetical protein
MANKNDLLMLVDGAVGLDDDSKEVNKRIRGVSVPMFGLKSGQAASWQVNGQTRSKIGQTEQDGVELGHRTT